MDLVAIVTKDNQLNTYRVYYWQLLSKIKTTQAVKITAVSWSPDGVHLAVGYENGSIGIYNVETGSPIEQKGCLETEASAQAEITALQWIQCSSDCKYTDRTGKFLLNPPPLPKHGGGYASFGQKEKDYQPIKTQDAPLTILIAGDDKGKVVYRAYGRVPVRSVDTGAPISNLVSALDLSRLHAVGKEIYDFDTTDLRDCSSELAVVSFHLKEISDLLWHLKQTITELSTHWKDATRVFKVKMSLMGPLLEKYECGNTPQELMFAMINSGISSPALAQFFTGNLNEQGVGRMQKSFDSGCENLQSLLHAHVQCCLEIILFRICELRGCSKFKEKFQSIGFDPLILGDFINDVKELHDVAETFLVNVHETRANFSLLFRWFQSTIRRLSGLHETPRMKLGRDDMRQLAIFLLQSREFDGEITNSLAKPLCDHLDRNISDSFVSLIDKIDNKWLSLVSAPVQASNIRLNHSIPISNGDIRLHCTAPSPTSESCLLNAFCDKNLIQIIRSASESRQYAIVAGSEIMSFDFYGDSELIVTCSNGNLYKIPIDDLIFSPDIEIASENRVEMTLEYQVELDRPLVKPFKISSCSERGIVGIICADSTFSVIDMEAEEEEEEEEEDNAMSCEDG